MHASEFSPELVAFVREARDRQDIHDCLIRYARGVDRHDRELMRSAYHVDAWDEHGVAEGDPETFCDWAIGFHGERQTAHQHIIANHAIEIAGDTAHSETYFIFWGENRTGPPTLAFGRYVDRFEKRDGVWAIAHRVCVNEKSGAFIETNPPQAWTDAVKSTGPNRRDREDVSYLRPLSKDRQRT